jgi:hypothetical protein
MPGAIRGAFGVEPPDPATREKAIEAPGASWREFFFFELAKVWIMLGLFVVDSLILVYWTDPFNPLALLASLFLAFYAELLLYRILWYRPNPEEGYLAREFRPTWIRPVRYGRWTPEAWRAKEGRDPFEDVVVGPDPREFL